jgi:hypothetical protein
MSVFPSSQRAHLGRPALQRHCVRRNVGERCSNPLRDRFRRRSSYSSGQPQSWGIRFLARFFPLDASPNLIPISNSLFTNTTWQHRSRQNNHSDRYYEYWFFTPGGRLRFASSLQRLSSVDHAFRSTRTRQRPPVSASACGPLGLRYRGVA